MPPGPPSPSTKPNQNLTSPQPVPPPVPPAARRTKSPSADHPAITADRASNIAYAPSDTPYQAYHKDRVQSSPIHSSRKIVPMANRSTTNHQATDDFFTLTRRVGAKRDPPDYTPNGTAEDAPQESQLGPSQAPEGQSCRLFYEDSDGEDLASPSIEASNSANQNPPGPPDGGNPNATAANAPGPRPIQILHHVYMRTAAGQLSQAANARNPPAAAAKEWERVLPRGTAVLLTDIANSNWATFKLDAVDAVDKTIPLLGAHLKSLNAQGLLKWQGIIMKHLTYSAKSNAMITTDGDFAPFVSAVLENPLSKVQVKITMNDPRRAAQEQQQERAQQDTLAMSYGPEDTRLALEQAQACLVVNPRADVNAARSTLRTHPGR
ncbi:hypothetical protein PTTG_26805 [Puccinia triticina 1-1 BBBD Race 1]|uniref:Uncharacterized protein n=1 Tax=Puccinia triticina (isolate 1-1 / race 1 (BBBD)) TaxID=630390 RepID=A0A180GR58_PUCT1|nr:hypothetical protein PTTG_26805 [Puccinia triticina 1-1 BBBD Race 1]